MKKIFTFLISFLFCITSIFAQQRFISISTGISSGVIFYGSENVIEANKQLEDDGSRIILGGIFEIDVNPIKEVSFFAGTDLLCDFYNASPYASNHLSFDIPIGIKLYPNLKGLCFGIAYCYGFRSDFFNLEETGKENLSTPWGNGFKMLIEYNFSHVGKSRYFPTVGCYLKHIPRGENAYDNQLCAYICANF